MERDRRAASRSAGWLRTRTESGDRRASSVRTLLVAAQVAASVMLLVGATVLIGSLVKVLRVDPGFETTHGVAFDLSLSKDAYREFVGQRALVDRLDQALYAVNGVRGTCFTNAVPLEQGVQLCEHRRAVVVPVDVVERLRQAPERLAVHPAPVLVDAGLRALDQLGAAPAGAPDADDREQKREARRRRQSDIARLNLFLAERGEAAMLAELERCSVQGKIARLRRWLTEQPASSVRGAGAELPRQETTG